jgi:Ca2+-binding EF-hand superfamily protein
MMNPLMMALDADRNGEISAEEIKNASAALKKLDKNGDGKVTRDELRPDVPPGFGGRGQAGFRRPGGPGGGRPGAGSMVDRLMSLDANGDGKVDAQELPERMQRILERGDANGDKAIDREEAEKLAEQLQQRGAGRGAGRGGRPGGGPPAGKPRPQPPE